MDEMRQCTFVIRPLEDNQWAIEVYKVKDESFVGMVHVNNLHEVARALLDNSDEEINLNEDFLGN